MRPQPERVQCSSRTATPLSAIACSIDAARDRQRAGLVRGAQHDHVGRHVVAEERLGQRLARRGRRSSSRGARRRCSAACRSSSGKCTAVSRAPSRRWASGWSRPPRSSAPARARAGCCGCGGHQDVEAQVADRRCPAAILLRGLDRRARRSCRSRDHRAALLAEPGLVEPAHILAVEHRRGAEDLVDRDHAGAADAHHVEREAPRPAPCSAGSGSVARRAAVSRRSLLRRALARHRRSGTTGSRRAGTSSPCCTTTGGSGSCGRTRSRPAAPTGSSTSRRSRRSPRRPRSLMKTRVGGSASLPRLRRRRFSAAHCWSWISTVTPGVAAQHSLRLDEPVAVPDLDAVRASATRPVLVGVVGGDDDPLHALGLEQPASSAGTASAPAASWPPVIATALL